MVTMEGAACAVAGMVAAEAVRTRSNARNTLIRSILEIDLRAVKDVEGRGREGRWWRTREVEK